MLCFYYDAWSGQLSAFLNSLRFGWVFSPLIFFFFLFWHEGMACASACARSCNFSARWWWLSRTANMVGPSFLLPFPPASLYLFFLILYEILSYLCRSEQEIS